MLKNELQRWKELLKIAWPLIIANSFWNLQLTVDRIFLGSYSTEALGAAMAVMGVFWVPMALLQQTASYVTTFVAQYGLPAGLQWSLEGLAFTVFLIIMGRTAQGEAALAASSIAVTVMMLSVLPSMGVAQAVLTIVGQSLGEKKPLKAERATWDGVKITCLYMSTIALSFIFIPEFYLSWFKNEENAVLWGQVSIIVPSLLAIVALFTTFDSVYFNISFALKGAGDTRFVSLVALLLPWPFMVLPAYLVRDFQNAVVWAWGFAALYSLITVSTLLVRFFGGRWKTMSVIHQK